MKKIAIFAAVALAAGLVQAATVDWSVAGNTFVKSPSDESGNNRAKFYTVLVFSGADSTAVMAQLVAGNVGGAQSYTLSSGVTSSTGATSGSITGVGGATFNIFAVAFDTWGTTSGRPLSEAEYYSVGSTLTANTYEPPNPGVPAAWNSTNWGGSWTPVPEPTSFALIGLGAAALALRRRLRK